MKIGPTVRLTLAFEKLPPLHATRNDENILPVSVAVRSSYS